MIVADKYDEHQLVMKSLGEEGRKRETYRLSSNEIGKERVRPRSYWQAMKESKWEARVLALASQRG